MQHLLGGTSVTSDQSGSVLNASGTLHLAYMADHGSMLAEFCALTGAAEHVAEHYLSAHDWDIQRATDFFFEHPPDDAEALHAANVQEDEPLPFAAAGPRHAAAQAAAGPGSHALQDYVNMVDDEEEDLAILAQQRQAALQARQQQAEQEDDEDPMADPVAEDYLRARPFEVRGRNFTSTAPNYQPHAEAAGPAPGHAASAELELPDGIDAEEARMLEAALLGVPYQGRIPDWNRQREPPVLSAEAAERLAYMQQQDMEFEESLAADRAKLESQQEAQRRAEEEQRLQQEAAAAEAAAAAEVQRQLQQALEAKRQLLSTEPEAGSSGAVRVMVRLPDGSRKGRRFLTSHPLQRVFDFVDVECGGEGCAEGAVKPGSYNLVLPQFPRRVLKDGSLGTLAEAGVDADCVLNVELL